MPNRSEVTTVTATVNAQGAQIAVLVTAPASIAVDERALTGATPLPS